MQEKYAGLLSRLIRSETVSQYDEKNLDKFRAFHALLKETFPLVFQTVRTEDFDGSLLLLWKSKCPQPKAPILLMNHHDVVEASGTWRHEPFSAEIADGKLWGRGTLDTKGGLFAMLQAAEELIASGYEPDRDIYFESACNEETTGAGADRISQVLKERGVKLDLVLDEGGMIVYDPIGGADATFAMVGVGEKGCADLRFTARSDGGHASTPAKNSPLARLAKFINAVEKGGIFTSGFSPTVKEMFRRMAPAMKAPLSFVFAHAGLFAPLIKAVVPSISPTANAMFKTTLAFTTAGGSEGLNVMPSRAFVTGNMRFSHHQGGKASIEAVKKIADKYGVETEILDSGFESPVSDYRSEGFRLVEKAVSELFPDVITAPYIMNGASDARYFSRVCDTCLRFLPFKIDEQQLESIHGADENIDLACLPAAVEFYKIIIKGR